MPLRFLWTILKAQYPLICIFFVASQAERVVTSFAQQTKEMQKFVVEGLSIIRLRANRRFQLSNIKIVSFSTESDAKASLDRATKLKALFGVTAANSGRKPTGVLIKETTEISEVANTTVKGAELLNTVAAKDALKVEDKSNATDSKDSAERTWLDSGYIEYMDNQRDKGWKS